MRPDLIRVVLVDDHQIVRVGLKAVLANEKGMVVVGEGGTGREALALAERFDPHVIVLDLSMPDMDGLTATRTLTALNALRAQIPGEAQTRRVLVLTMHMDDEHLVALLEAGAAGYLVKTAVDREIVDAIRTVAAGEIYVQPNTARALARWLTSRGGDTDDRSQYDRLTDREQQVLRCVAQGFTAPEIGDQLAISPKTVDTYKQRISEKLGFTHRSDYVQFALRIGLLKPDA